MPVKTFGKTARMARAVERPPAPVMTVERTAIHFRYLSGTPVLRWRMVGSCLGLRMAPSRRLRDC